MEDPHIQCMFICGVSFWPIICAMSSDIQQCGILTNNTIQGVLLASNNTMLLAIKHTCMSEQN